MRGEFLEAPASPEPAWRVRERFFSLTPLWLSTKFLLKSPVPPLGPSVFVSSCPDYGRFSLLLCSSTMQLLFLVSAVWVQIWTPTWGYGTGAPTSVCGSMLPSHGVAAQTVASPFTIQTNSTGDFRTNQTLKGERDLLDLLPHNQGWLMFCFGKIMAQCDLCNKWIFILNTLCRCWSKSRIHKHNNNNKNLRSWGTWSSLFNICFDVCRSKLEIKIFKSFKN